MTQVAPFKTLKICNIPTCEHSGPGGHSENIAKRRGSTVKKGYIVTLLAYLNDIAKGHLVILFGFCEW